ncbi:MAG: CNNM domain-containing protein [Acidimicrobiales bacterium]
MAAGRQAVGLHRRCGAGKSSAKSAVNAMSDLSMHLAGAQLGITMASLALGYLGEPALAALIEKGLGQVLSPELTHGIGFATALSIVVLLHLVIGEMVPKNIALVTPDRTTRVLVLPYRVYLTIFRPAVRFLNALAAAGCRAIGVEPRDEVLAAHSAQELAEIVTHSSEGGAIEADNAELLRVAIKFAEQPVSSVARPLDEVQTLRLGSTAAQAERVVHASGQTRIPLAAATLGSVRFVGYFHAKDLINLSASERMLPLPSTATRRMAVVKHDRSLIEVLRVLRGLRRHLAVVVDADGEPIGIASIEDVIRALAVGPPAVPA